MVIGIQKTSGSNMLNKSWRTWTEILEEDSQTDPRGHALLVSPTQATQGVLYQYAGTWKKQLKTLPFQIMISLMDYFYKKTLIPEQVIPCHSTYSFPEFTK